MNLDVSEKTKFIKYLTRQGATIEDLNTIRARLSQVKGGKLLSAAKGAAFVHTFILSDIINNPGNRLNDYPLACQRLHRSTPEGEKFISGLISRVPIERIEYIC